jgi:ABC-type phosphate transport system substrate-binding protein
MQIRFLLLSFFFAVMVSSGLIHSAWAQTQTIYVIANMDVQDSALSRTDIQNIYLGKKTKWGNNQGINFTALGGGSCHEAFVKEYVGRTDFQFQNYWKKQIFTGNGQPPRSFNSEAELIDYVSRTSGAIGYSCVPPAGGNVKTLTIN